MERSYDRGNRRQPFLSHADQESADLHGILMRAAREGQPVDEMELRRGDDRKDIMAKVRAEAAGIFNLLVPSPQKTAGMIRRRKRIFDEPTTDLEREIEKAGRRDDASAARKSGRGGILMT